MALLQIYWGFCLASIVVFCVPEIYAAILLYVVVFLFFFPAILIIEKIMM